jgi:hypothetical protein
MAKKDGETNSESKKRRGGNSLDVKLLGVALRGEGWGIVPTFVLAILVFAILLTQPLNWIAHIKAVLWP